MSRIKTHDVDLPSGQKAKIRRIGFAAHAKLESMLPKYPATVAEFAMGKKGQITDKTTVDELRAMGGAAILPDLLVYIETKNDKQQDARIYRVCACTVSPTITPDTVDAALDGADFLALEKAIDELHAEGDVLHFSKTSTA